MNKSHQLRSELKTRIESEVDPDELERTLNQLIETVLPFLEQGLSEAYVAERATNEGRQFSIGFEGVGSVEFLLQYGNVTDVVCTSHPPTIIHVFKTTRLGKSKKRDEKGVSNRT